jgi:hypothetical protein
MNKDAVVVMEQLPPKYRNFSVYTSGYGNIYTAEANTCLDMIDFMATRSKVKIMYPD